MFQAGNRISSGINCMRQNKKVFFLSQFLIHFHHISIHLRTDAFAGSKEKLYYIGLTFYILFRNLLAVLSRETKMLHIIQGRQFGFTHVSDVIQDYEKNDHQNRKKGQIKNRFLTHYDKVIGNQLQAGN